MTLLKIHFSHSWPIAIFPQRLVFVCDPRLEVSFLGQYVKSFTNYHVSAIVGMAMTLISIPLPGYITKLLKDIQTERMKKVQHLMIVLQSC